MAGSNDRNDCIVTWRRQRRRLQQNLQATSSRALAPMSDIELDRSLGQLCNDLMDYIATGHASIYTRLHQAPARAADEHNCMLRDIRLHLGMTTDAVLRFNHRCETTPPTALQQRVQTELGRLGKTLSLRYALEEQLLELGNSADWPTAN